MAFDAIIKEFLRFIDDRHEDLKDSEARQRIAMIITNEMMTNSHLGLHEFAEHVSKRIIVELLELSQEEANNGI